MNRVVKLFDSGSVVIERFDHPAHRVHCDHDFEKTQRVAVAFVERGRFALQQHGRLWGFRPGDVLVATPGILRRYRHFEESPDDICLSISFAPETVEDALGNFRSSSLAPRIMRCPATEFAYSSIRSSLDSLDTLCIEELAFHSMLGMSSDSWRQSGRPSVSTAHARRIRIAIERMSEKLAERCPLASISREVGMSPFHFARTFSGLVGLPPHQYLLRLRLRRSARMLREGASVTTAALSSGFENLAHFTRSFRRRFGVNPSKYPRAPPLTFLRHILLRRWKMTGQVKSPRLSSLGT